MTIAVDAALPPGGGIRRQMTEVDIVVERRKIIDFSDPNRGPRDGSQKLPHLA